MWFMLYIFVSELDSKEASLPTQKHGVYNIQL